MIGDVLSIETDEQLGEKLIEPVMAGGRRLAGKPTLGEIRVRAARELKRLPEPLRRLEPGAAYPVDVAPALKALAAEADRRIAGREKERA
jgi:nicotinate phosphoribosyltransferase